MLGHGSLLSLRRIIYDTIIHCNAVNPQLRMTMQRGFAAQRELSVRPAFPAAKADRRPSFPPTLLDVLKWICRSRARDKNEGIEMVEERNLCMYKVTRDRRSLCRWNLEKHKREREMCRVKRNR